MTITTKYDIGQAFVFDGQPVVIQQIKVELDGTIKYYPMWKSTYMKLADWMTEKEIDLCIALNENYLSNKEQYAKCLNTAKKLEELARRSEAFGTYVRGDECGR